MRTALGCLMLFLAGIAPVKAQPAGDPTTGPTLAERLGFAPDDRLLIVHADDAGVAHSVNAATIAALASGLVTSASIMVPCPWFPEIAAYAAAHPEADFGLHLTLTSEWKHYRWAAVLGADVPSLHDARGYLYADADTAARRANPREAEAELRAQVERALAFGIRPTHLDTHMGTLFGSLPLFAAYLRVGRSYGLPVLLPREALQQPAGAPLRALLQPTDVLVDRIVMAGPAVPEGEWAAYYTRVIETLQPGVTELIVHVAYDDAEMQAVTADHPAYGAAWRQRDFDFFTSDAFRRLLDAHGVRLLSWREVGERLRKP
jgi:predicted glycoside hydrolase/deacetylase ChbG (UPF0249 family)